MSRAFIKEQDAEQLHAEIIERPQSEHPNYITSQGLESLKLQFDELRQRKVKLNEQQDDIVIKNEIVTLEADMRYLEKRILSAIPVEISSQCGDEIRFGATVDLIDENDVRYTFTIVGEDETDTSSGYISWVSPLAQELLGKKVGDDVIWFRPAGDLEMKILDILYQQN